MYASLKRGLARRPALILIVILLIGLIPRATMLTGVGHVSDTRDFYRWAVCATGYNFVGLYRCDPAINHAPIGPLLHGISFALYRAAGGDLLDDQLFVLPAAGDSAAAEQFLLRLRAAFADRPALVAALKLPGLIFELALISLVFYVAYQRRELAGRRWRRRCCAFNPGWMAVTAWWGQTDSIFTFFLLLTAYLLTRDRPRWAWGLTRWRGWRSSRASSSFRC